MSSDENRYLEPLQLAGEIIMENGGETYRVEETITRMGHAFGLTKVESFAVPSGVFVSYCRSDGETETGVMRIRRKEINLSRVNDVNTVSRLVEAGKLDAEGALRRLREIRTSAPLTSPRWMPAASGLCAGGFAIMFGGGAAEFLIAGIAAAIGQWLTVLPAVRQLSAMIAVLIGSFVTAFIPLTVHSLTGIGVAETMVAGALMPLLPGLAMTNAVQDTMRGDVLSGMSHGVSALLTAAMVACGTLIAAMLVLAMGGVSA